MIRKEEVIDRLAKKGYTKKSANLIIDDVVRVLSEALVEGEEIQLHGFGTFYVRNMAPRETTDLVTGERITIPGHNLPKFTPGSTLKRWVMDGIIRE